MCVADLKETGLVPAMPEATVEERPTPEETYSFTTECFFMTHYSLHLGFRVLHEQFIKRNQDLHHIQSAYQDLVQQGNRDADMMQRLKEDMEKS